MLAKHTVLNFTYEDNIKIKNKYVAGISRTFYLATETISRPSQSGETIYLSIVDSGWKIAASILLFVVPTYADFSARSLWRKDFSITKIQ
jgi:hypothetical protein